MSDILPYSQDTSGTKVKRSKYKEDTPVIPDEKRNGVTSLSFEQVNNDADELIELRGEGRYFGVTDPSDAKGSSLGPLCANCHKRGHIRSKCKIVICHKCGKVGDHYETQCPTTMICGRCGEKGHYMNECKSRIRKKQYCKRCDSFQHNDENCLSIWRSYLIIRRDDSSKTNESLPNMSCYNCGSSQHYGDECYSPRSSRVPNLGSAFSGNNLPREYRSLYFDKIRTYSNDEDDYNPQHPYKNNDRNYSRYATTSMPSRTGMFPSKPKLTNKINYDAAEKEFLPRLPKKPQGNYSKSHGSYTKPQNTFSKPQANFSRFNSNTQPSRSGIIKRNHNNGNPKFQPTRSGTLNANNKHKKRKLKY